ncbi:MAG: TonB family protein [Desulfuromonadaceae bacterium]|nr:TonB family protein [Desulfuromonadaceae bacterium]MDD2854060.1 TonB family protein [Desulfuromonadaceae bacterium]
MDSRSAKIDTGMSASFIASAVIHLAVFLLFVWWGEQFSPQMALQETYYVDVVDLPVTAPQAGEEIQKTDEPKTEVPQVQPLAPTPSPSEPVTKKGTKFLKPAAPQSTAESEAAFQERMAKLAEKNEAQQIDERINRISSKVKSKAASKAGTPGAGGAERGSRYSDYIKSRLEDALKITSYSTTQNPEIAVRITISAEGRLLRIKVERSSGDSAFELSVRRAIDLASQKFTAPPDNNVFENGFLFRPKGILNNSEQ